MRLILRYTAGDGYTWSSEDIVPVVYESGEALIVDFENEAKKAFANRNYCFVFAGKEYSTDYFFVDGKYYPPEILTVDEWFNEISEKA